MKGVILTGDAPRPVGAYSQGLVVGNLVFVAGQGPLDPVTGNPVGSTIEEQTEAVLRNVGAILAAAGATLDDVVKSTVHLADLSLFGRFDSTYARFFSDPKPVRTTVGSALDGILVEIDVIAYRIA